MLSFAFGSIKSSKSDEASIKCINDTKKCFINEDCCSGLCVIETNVETDADGFCQHTVKNLKFKTTNCIKANQTCSNDEVCCSKNCKNGACEKINIIRENWIQLAIVASCVAGLALVFGIVIFVVKKCKKTRGGHLFRRKKLINVNLTSEGYITPDN